MLKFKVFTTVFLLYEFVAISVLHINRSCGWLFGQKFCTIGNFRYFVLCVMIPVLIGLIIWWLPKKEKQYDKNYFVKFAVIVVFVAIRHLIRKYPKTRRFFDEVSDALSAMNIKK